MLIIIIKISFINTDISGSKVIIEHLQLILTHSHNPT